MKISNQTAYPAKPVVKPDDYLIGTDYENNLKTKTFPVSFLADAVGLYLGVPNVNTGLISVGSIDVVADEVTLNDVIYKINGIEFSIPTQSFTISPATDGFYRNDIIYGTDAGTLSYLEGEEDPSNPVQPVTPAGTVLVTVINVFGDEIIAVIPPIEDIMLKSSEGQQPFYEFGTIPQLAWSSKNTFRWLSPLSTGELRSMDFSANPEYMYDGRLLTIINQSPVFGQLTIKHNLGTGNLKFYLPDSLDLLILPGYVAVFKYTQLAARLELISFSNPLPLVNSDKRVLYTAVSDTDTFIVTELIGASLIQMISSNVAGNVMGSAITFDSITGEISNFGVLTGDEILIFYLT